MVRAGARSGSGRARGYSSATTGKTGRISDFAGNTRVFIVAEIRLYREGLADAIGSAAGIEVVGTAANGLSELDEMAAASPHVVLLELASPNGLQAVRAISRRIRDAVAVVLAVTDTEEDLIACAEAGVVGFVTREQSLDDVTSVVRSAARGEVSCPPRVAGALLRRLALLAEQKGPMSRAMQLTAREMEIAVLIEQGRSNKEIARTLFIELPTVKTHVHRILEKLGVQRRGQAAAQVRAHHRLALQHLNVGSVLSSGQVDQGM